MVKSLRYVLALFLLLLLGACASLPPYQSPTGGHLAQVTFHAYALNKGGFMTKTDLDFYVDPCNPKQSGWVGLNSKHTSQSVRVPADRPLRVFISYDYHSGQYSESGTASLLFVPRTGMDYAVAFTKMGNRFKVGVARMTASGASQRVRTLYGDKAVNAFQRAYCPARKKG